MVTALEGEAGIESAEVVGGKGAASGAPVAAAGTLTMDTQPSNTDTVTIDEKVYTWQTTLTDVDGNIEIGATLAISKTNLVNAITLGGTPGTGYAASMTLHPTVTIAAFVGDDAVLTAKTAGAAGNAIETVETFTAGTNVFDAATLGTTVDGKDVTPGMGYVGVVTVASGATVGAAQTALNNAETAINTARFINDPEVTAT
jgi:hypothetical protein